MNSRLMMSVAAAALIAGSGFAFAQGTGGAAGGPAGAGSPPTAQQKPAPSGGAMSRDAGESKVMKDAPSDSMKNVQSKDGMSKDGMKKDSAQSKDGMSKDGAKNAQSRDGMSKDGMKDSAQSKEGRSGSTVDTKSTADTKSGATTDTKSGATADTKSGVTTDTKSGATADTKAGAASQTTGNAATSATAAPPAEKRTQIVSAIRSANVPEAGSVNFNISVGVAVPSSVRFYPLPPRIVEIYPEWRGYEVIRVRGKWVIVRPQTRTIVYVIEG